LKKKLIPAGKGLKERIISKEKRPVIGNLIERNAVQLALGLGSPIA